MYTDGTVSPALKRQKAQKMPYCWPALKKIGGVSWNLLRKALNFLMFSRLSYRTYMLRSDLGLTRWVATFLENSAPFSSSKLPSSSITVILHNIRCFSSDSDSVS